MKKTYKIYMLNNKINSKKYIGMTGVKYPSTRKGQHLHNLRKNKHDNDHLQSAFNSYGEEVFDFVILYDNLTENEAKNKERELITFYNTQDRNFGYNVEPGGEIISLSEESKNKIRNALKGRKISEEQRKAHSELMKHNNPMSGKTHTTEAREKIRKASLLRSKESRLHSEETKEKIGAAHRGRKMSIEQREKISSSKKGKPLSELQLKSLEKARENTRWAKRKKKLQIEQLRET